MDVQTGRTIKNVPTLTRFTPTLKGGTLSLKKVACPSAGGFTDRMDPGLRRHVGNEALAHLAARGPGVRALSFDLRSHAVTVTSSGVVLVDGTRQAVRTWRPCRSGSQMGPPQ